MKQEADFRDVMLIEKSGHCGLWYV